MAIISSPAKGTDPGEEYRQKVQTLNKKIFSASNLDEILIDLKDDILGLFEAERITIYFVDGVKRELVSRYKTGSEVEEIRVPLSPTSIAGYAAYKQTIVNIADVYDKRELAKIDGSMNYDDRWDKRTGFTSKQMLVAPIIFKKMLIGAIQLINHKNKKRFSEEEENSLKELAETMGIGLYNQKKMQAAKKGRGKFDHLMENHILTQKEVKEAAVKAREHSKTIEEVLIKEYNVPKNEIGESLAKYYDAPFRAYDNQTPIPGHLLAGLKVPFMKKNVWVPLGSTTDGVIQIAIDDPYDTQRVNEIRALFSGRTLRFCVSFKEDIFDFIELFTTDDTETASIDQILSQMQAEDNEVAEAEAGLDEESSAIVQLVNKIIFDAYNRNASDIHIEPYPGKKNTEVRIRIDGACTLYQTIPYNYRAAVVSRLKIMANLDIAERRKPQDGKIAFKKYGGLDIELRVATVPTQGGVEDVVMRILAAGEPIPIEKMGFSEQNLKKFLECINKPYGIVFVCGPTGSGKTTTLHSALKKINKVETKIWTAEDPVEITQVGLRQVQVQPKIGFDFAAAMRSFLRADPDVIMVGEMRDKETTHIGIEASLTGHLVFSTLHTNSAPESITRLLDMGMDPYNFADALLCILAQRLVRTLCKDCKKKYHPTQKEYEDLVHAYGGEEEYNNRFGVPYTEEFALYKPNGCNACNNTGYRGRMGLHELLIGSDTMKRAIIDLKPVEELRKLSMKEGMKTLLQDGIEKVVAGHTDLLMVRKVCIA
jgi:type II secretory ATPase GspE/PulE/Tfp pilus assembly ATPase PilB-like protein/putative methionine-R-sulfoxide reductase with GAF domain